MSFSLGYIDNGAGPNIQNYYSVKEDQLEDSSLNLYRGAENSLFVSDKSAKASIQIDLDFLQDSDYKTLRDIALDRARPNKFYFRHPGNVTGAMLTPSSSVNVVGVLQSNNANPVLTDFGTAFTSGDYTNINGFSTPVVYNNGIYQYVHYLFSFNLGAWETATGDTSINNLIRLTLFMQNPTVWRDNSTLSLPNDRFGFKVRALNYAKNIWTEIYRRSITVAQPNQQAAPLRPVSGFTKMIDYVSTGAHPDLVYFMVSTLQPWANASGVNQGVINLSMGYTALLVNGFMVRLADTFNLNWREEVTLQGRTGSLKLEEC